MEASTGMHDATLRLSTSSQATQDIAKEIAIVDHTASQMTGDSDHVRVSAAEICKVAEYLQRAVARFHAWRHELVWAGPSGPRESSLTRSARAVLTQQADEDVGIWTHREVRHKSM